MFVCDAGPVKNNLGKFTGRASRSYRAAGARSGCKLIGTALLAWCAFSAGEAMAASPIAGAPVVERPLAAATAETPGEQPTAQHQWVPGHWRWIAGAYVWEAGRWEIPPATNVVWHSSEWQRQGSGYVLCEGYWDEAPPATVAATLQPAGAPPEIVVTVPPPPPQREVIVERPSPQHIWIGGHWSWRAGQHVWIGGGWALAPRQNASWVAPRWEYRGGRYIYIAGYWRDAVAVTSPPSQVAMMTAPDAPVMVVAPPPPPRSEVVYGPPGPGYVWIKGYWSWRDGQYVWVAGHYERPPAERREWIEPRWEPRGGSYVFIEGRWGEGSRPAPPPPQGKRRK